MYSTTRASPSSAPSNMQFQQYAYTPSHQASGPAANASYGGGQGAAGMQAMLNAQDQYALAHQYQQQQQQQQQQAQMMAQQPPVQAQMVGDEEYNRLLKNYRLAHERIEDQRLQMLEQEKQNATLRKHIGLLEGGDNGGVSVVGVHQGGGGGSTVDDFTIKNSSSGLERRINRWAADTLSSYARAAPAPPPGTDAAAFAHLALVPLAEALFSDIDAISQSPFLLGLAQQGFDYPGLGIVVQSLLRHIMSSMLADGIVNQLLVTNSNEANMELTKLHEQLFNREPLVASVWRRQTFSAAVESLSPSMSFSIFQEHMPALFALINPSPMALAPPLASVLEASYTYSRMLHASHSPMGGGAIESSGFYRAYCPVIGSQLDPTQLELIKKCYRCERGESERVGACLFPGLVKESAIDTTPLPLNSAHSLRHNAGAPEQDHHGSAGQPKRKRETRRVVVRRAQVICECALAAAHGGMPSARAPSRSTVQPEGDVAY